MWKQERFNSEGKARQFMVDNARKFQMNFLFVRNGFVVEYKPLRKVG